MGFFLKSLENKLGTVENVLKIYDSVNWLKKKVK